MPVALVAYQPDIAPNLGALMRLAACFGRPLHVIEPCGFPFAAKAVRRTAMDYADLAEVHRHDSWSQFQALGPAGRRVLLTTAGSDPLWDVHFHSGDLLILGRESAGVPPEVHTAADLRVRIPMPGAGRSLNVAASGAIVLAEALRQLSR